MCQCSVCMSWLYSFTSQDTDADKDLWFQETLLCKKTLKSNLVHHGSRRLFIHLPVHIKARSGINNQRPSYVQTVCEIPLIQVVCKSDPLLPLHTQSKTRICRWCDGCARRWHSRYLCINKYTVASAIRIYMVAAYKWWTQFILFQLKSCSLLSETRVVHEGSYSIYCHESCSIVAHASCTVSMDPRARTFLHKLRAVRIVWDLRFLWWRITNIIISMYPYRSWWCL